MVDRRWAVGNIEDTATDISIIQWIGIDGHVEWTILVESPQDGVLRQVLGYRVAVVSEHASDTIVVEPDAGVGFRADLLGAGVGNLLFIAVRIGVKKDLRFEIKIYLRQHFIFSNFSNVSNFHQISVQKLIQCQ